MSALWQPQPGPQTIASVCPCDFTFFGGTRGGGKSDCLLGRQLIGANKYKNHWNGIVFRRKYKDFSELRIRIDELIEDGLPATRIGGEQMTNYVRFQNGARFQLAAAQNLKMIEDHVGQQYTEIAIDECTTFPFFPAMVDKLWGSLRSPHGVPCRMFGTGNPGGPGHMSVKDMLVDPAEPGNIFYDEIGNSFVFIRSVLDDNQKLCENDPKYANRLRGIRDPALRAAWFLGDWNVFIGQAFAWREEYHTCDPMPVPARAPLYMTYDWGYGKPFSIGWWWVDSDGRVYRFSEWYGFSGKDDDGLRITDSEVAEGILEREAQLGIQKRKITRLCDPTCMNKKPDYKGGGQGPSTAEEFAAYGIYLLPGDPSRSLKIRQFRERMRVKKDNDGNLIERPMMQVYRTCKQFLRTVPMLAVDDDNPEDIDTDQEDHCFTGDTLIAGPYGFTAPIKEMVGTSGYVFNKNGKLTKYESCRLTRKSAALIELTFSDSSIVKCTPNHLFMVKDGSWKKAIDLLDEECYISGQSKRDVCKSKLFQTLFRNSMGSDIICAAIIFSIKAEDFIVKLWNTIKEQCLKAKWSITETETDPIIKSRIYNSSKPVHISQSTEKTEITLPGLKRRKKAQENGMAAKRAKSGIKNNLNSTAEPLSRKNIQELANTVDHHFRDQRLPSTAIRYAVSQNTKRIAVKQIRSVSPEPVFCLYVPKGSAFALGNGVMVHNCFDEACHILMARPLKAAKQLEQRSSVDQWFKKRGK